MDLFYDYRSGIYFKGNLKKIIQTIENAKKDGLTYYLLYKALGIHANREFDNLEIDDLGILATVKDEQVVYVIC